MCGGGGVKYSLNAIGFSFLPVLLSGPQVLNYNFIIVTIEFWL